MRLESLRNRSTRIVIPGRTPIRRQRSPLALALLLLGLACASAGAVRAATFEELYTVSVTPDPAARDVNADATRRGMRTLLTRITGSRQAATDPRLSGLIADATDHATGYLLVSDDEMRISFSRRSINDTLTRLGLPIWGDERPATLLWIAMDFGAGQRAELSASPDPRARQSGPSAGAASNALPDAAEEVFEAAVEAMLTIADERGLPLILPRLDSQERRLVRFADVWGGVDEALEQFATDRGADAILIGRLAATEQGASMRWTLRRGEQRQEFATADPGAGVERLAEIFAAEYTIVGEARERLVTIRGVRAWSDWQVLEYLESLSIVDRVIPRGLTREGDLELSILARGDDARLSQVLTLGGVLAVPEPDAGSPLPTARDTGALVLVPAWRIGAESTEAP